MFVTLLSCVVSLVPSCTIPLPFIGEVLVMDHPHDFKRLESEYSEGGTVTAYLGKREFQFSPRAALVSCGCWEVGRMAEVGCLSALAGAVAGYLAGA